MNLYKVIYQTGWAIGYIAGKAEAEGADDAFGLANDVENAVLAALDEGEEDEE